MKEKFDRIFIMSPVQKGQAKVTIIIPIRHISESESLDSWRLSGNSLKQLNPLHFSLTAMGQLGGLLWVIGGYWGQIRGREGAVSSGKSYALHLLFSKYRHSDQE